MQLVLRHAARPWLAACCKRTVIPAASSSVLNFEALNPQPSSVTATTPGLPAACAASTASTRHFFVNPFSSETPPAKTYEERRLVGYTPEQLFSVVSKVENYKDFVPFCMKSHIIKHGTDYFEAELEVGFQLFVERYTSKVTVKHPQLVRSAVSDHRLFDHLDSEWVMKPGPVPNSCWLSFSVDFAFRSPLYRHAAEVFFQEVVKQMMGAFEQRCRDLYGPSALRQGAGKHTAPTSA